MKRYLLSIVLPILFTLSCTTMSREMPTWVSNPTQTETSRSLFVAFGKSKATNEKDAIKRAKEDALKTFEYYLSLNISLESFQSIKKEQAIFLSDIKTLLSKEFFSSTDNIRIVKKYIKQEKQDVEVYLLVEYKKEYLEKAKQHLFSLLNIEQGYKKEHLGDQYFQKKDYYKSAIEYINASTFFSENDFVQAETNFKRSISKAIDSVKKIKITEFKGFQKTNLGEIPKEDIVATFMAGGQPVKDLPIDFIFEDYLQNGQRIRKTYSVKTDIYGRSAIRLDAPEQVGEKKLVVRLNLNTILKDLNNVEDEFNKYLSILQQEILNCSAVFEFEVVSRAAEVTTAIMIIDLDRSGNPFDKFATATAIANELQAEGFNVNVIPADSKMNTLSDNAIIEIFRKQYGKEYQRLIFGSAKISSFEEISNSINLIVYGEIKVFDILKGKIVYLDSEQKRARGSDNSIIITASFQSLGRTFAKKIATAMP